MKRFIKNKSINPAIEVMADIKKKVPKEKEIELVSINELKQSLFDHSVHKNNSRISHLIDDLIHFR